jgi:hypothetical protein
LVGNTSLELNIATDFGFNCAVNLWRFSIKSCEGSWLYFKIF